MQNNKFNILIVDDDAKNIKLVASFLSVVKNYNLSYATNGSKALELLKDKPYDLILLDINMPVMDGFELCKRIKEDPYTKNIPVIFLTAMLDDKSMETGFRLGAADYITKPIKKLELVSRVKTIFAFHQYEKKINSLKKRILFLDLINKTSIDAQVNPIIFHDREKMFLCNKAFLKLLHYESVEAFLDANKSLLGLIYDSNCQTNELADLHWLEKISNEMDDAINRVSIRSSGALKHFFVSVEKIKYGNNLQYIVFFNEVNKKTYDFTRNE